MFWSWPDRNSIYKLLSYVDIRKSRFNQLFCEVSNNCQGKEDKNKGQKPQKLGGRNMAETLGSLIDKLAIKSIKEFYIKRMLQTKKAKFSKCQLKDKLKILKKQKRSLLKEIEEFIVEAPAGKIALSDEKLKLYNKPHLIGRIGKINSVSGAIDGLTKKNLELWHLEDEARREDVSLSYIGSVKKKIDVANQQRNDLIDKFDALFEQKLKNLKN